MSETILFLEDVMFERKCVIFSRDSSVYSLKYHTKDTTKITIPMISNLIAIVFIVIAILMAIPKLIMSSQQKLKTSQEKIKNIKNIKNPFPLKKPRG